MLPFPTQPLILGDATHGYPPNVPNQLSFQYAGLAQSDFPPLPSPFLPQQNQIPIQPPSYLTQNPLVNPPHPQHDPNNKYDSDVDFNTDTSDVENGKENADEGNETQTNIKHGWQHVKKRKRIHQSVEPRTLTTPETSTQNRYTPLLPRQENEESPQTSTHRDSPNIPETAPPPYLYMESKTSKPCWMTLQM